DSSLQAFPETDETSLEQAFNFLLQRQLRGNRIIVFSDFWQWHNGLAARLQPLTRKNDCRAVIIQDPLEMNLPQGGYYNVSDGENTYRLNTHNTDFKQHYYQQQQQRQLILHQTLRQLNVPILPLWTTDTLVTQLKTLFV
ncbi:MAG: hypothetical protein K2Q33_02460, partial [Gammaproteobacteria bacterium]|nr:hypothetical protein [Gammaproteobacteria bacterium]